MAARASTNPGPETPPDRCRLCLKVRPLLKSHVLPEFLYKPTYTAKGGALSFNKNIARVRILRKGIRQRLLCQECELLIKVHEDYFASEWLQASRVPDPLPVHATEISVSDLDYRRFKLFHLSVVWRTGIAEGDYAPIELGAHQEPLRQALLAGDAGRPETYPVFGRVLRMRKQPRPMMGIALSPPEHLGGVLVASTVYAGCQWCCVLEPDGPTEFTDLYLTAGGAIVLPIDSVESLQSLVNLVSGHGESFRKVAQKLQ